MFVGIPGVQGLWKVFRCFAATCRSSAARLAAKPATSLPTHARPVQMQTFLQWFPPKKGSTNIACEDEEISFIYSILVYTLSTSKKARKRERNENNFYLSFVIVCKIIYTRRKFLFHPKLPFSSSVWLSVLLRFPNLKNSLVFFVARQTSWKTFIQPKHRYTRCTFVLLLFYFVNIFEDFSAPPKGARGRKDEKVKRNPRWLKIQVHSTV